MTGSSVIMTHQPVGARQGGVHLHDAIAGKPKEPGGGGVSDGRLSRHTKDNMWVCSVWKRRTSKREEDGGDDMTPVCEPVFEGRGRG